MSKLHRPHLGDARWEEVELLRYKEEGSAPFKDVTRQVLFDDPTQASQLRYFEVGAQGYSTLERHVHAHAVLVLRGQGRCMVGEEVFDLAPNDLVHVPALTWHQFRALDEPLGFLCMVNRERDKPQLPSPGELEALCSNPRIAAFLMGDAAGG